MIFDLTGYRPIVVAPVSGVIGAEVSGVDLSRPVDEVVFGEIRRALLEFHVLFFRDQELDARSLAAFAERFGPLTLAPQATPIAEHPFIVRLSREADVPSSVRNIGDQWHADQSPRERPSLGFALYCLEAPDYGGDTLFASMEAAYQALSDEMRALCDGLTAVHSDRGMFGRGDGTDGKRPIFHAGVKPDEETLKRTLAVLQAETEHPLVRVIPETGRRSLFVAGPYAIRFKGMSEAESRPLLDFLQAHATRPEFTCRLRWRAGTLALLDNRCTQHYALNDYGGFRRVMLRAEIGGERPLSIEAAAAEREAAL